MAGQPRNLARGALHAPLKPVERPVAAGPAGVSALVARVVEDGFGIAAVALVVILARLPAADRR